jgi:hypothetical protein
VGVLVVRFMIRLVAYIQFICTVVLYIIKAAIFKSYGVCIDALEELAAARARFTMTRALSSSRSTRMAAACGVAPRAHTSISRSSKLDTSPVRTQKIARRVEGKGQKAMIVSGDLSQASLAEWVVDQAFGAFGRVGSSGITVNTIVRDRADTPFYHGQETPTQRRTRHTVCRPSGSVRSRISCRYEMQLAASSFKTRRLSGW